MITIDKNSISEYTLVPNVFIESYIADAEGDYVKVYLDLLMRTSADRSSFELASVCDALNMSERKIRNALKYWEEEGLLELFYTGGSLAGIRFLSPGKAAKAREKHRLPTERVKALKKGDAEARQIIFVAESYFGRPLTMSETADLLYLHDKLGFSADLCDYLLEYSITHGAKGMNYAKTVALAWHAEGIKTVEEAKANSRIAKEPGSTGAKKGSRPGNAGKNKFLDFEHHDYDLKELARRAKD